MDFVNTDFLTDIQWIVSQTDFSLRNQTGFIKDTNKIKEVLEKRLISWQTDANGNVLVDFGLDEKDKPIYLKFKPAEFPTAFSFINLVLTFFDEDTEMTMDQFRNFYQTKLSLESLVLSYKNMSEKEINNARLSDKVRLNKLLEKITTKGYISRGFLRTLTDDNIFFMGVYSTAHGIYALDFSS